MELSGSPRPVHRVLQEYSGLSEEYITLVNEQDSRPSMTEVLKAIVHTVIKRCYSDLCYANCEGCVLDYGNQLGHDCLTWTERFHDRLLKHVCSRLNMAPVLHVTSVIAGGMQCLRINENAIKYLSMLVASIHNADRPGGKLRELFKKCNPTFLNIVDRFLCNKFEGRDLLYTFL